MSKGFYVIVEQDWEYNDEYYSRKSGSNPKIAYNEEEKEEAERVCAEMNTKENLEIVGNSSWEYTRERCDLGDGPIEFFKVIFVPLREERPKPKFKIGDSVKGRIGNIPSLVTGKVSRAPSWNGNWYYTVLSDGDKLEYSPIFEATITK